MLMYTALAFLPAPACKTCKDLSSQPATLEAFDASHLEDDMQEVDQSAVATRVTTHYATGGLLEAIRAALKDAGADPDAPSIADLKPVDEFHLGGLEATEALLGPLGIDVSQTVADLGSGIGGTARFIADSYGAQVDGVDLTPEFVATATALSKMVGLPTKTRFYRGSVTDLPLEPESYDLATMFHVGMNLPDKTALFAEVRRILKPGGRFALFDLMFANPDGEITFPVPWASTKEGSFVEPPEAYRAAAQTAGLTQIAERNRQDYGKVFFRRVMKAAEENGVPPVGLHLIMGDTAQEKYANSAREVLDGTIAPWEMVFQKPL